MGGCASTQTRSKRSSSTSKEEAAVAKAAALIRVVHVRSGVVEELKPPISAAQLLSQHPTCFLCSADSMLLHTCPTRVPQPELLKPGYLYFLMPHSQANKPFSLEDLCQLAVMANSNHTIHDLQLSFRHYAL